MSLKPGQLKEFVVCAVHYSGLNGLETSIEPIHDVKPCRSRKEAQTKITRMLRKPKNNQSPIGYSESVLTILPMYRLKSHKPFYAE